MPTPPERKPPTPRPGAQAPGEDVTLPPEPSLSDTAAPDGRPADGRLPAQLPAPFGRYRLLKLLGEGGMGRVYLAHDSQLDRPVALKVPLFGPEDGPPLLERFYREARAAATVLHANVCPVYDVGEAGGVPYLTMAFIEGRPLGQFAAQRPLTPRQAAFLVRKLALALAEAHKRGVIHRDLKPSNVMVNRQGEPVVMDFGLARRAKGGDPRLTRQGAFLGTPAYAPPEQVSGEADGMGPACDVYSLGVILYELLAGRLPFEGDVLLMVSRVLLEEPPPPQFRPGLDPALEAICLKAMAKKPGQRYSSMAAFAGALQDYLRGQTTAAEPPPPPVPAAAAVAPARASPGLRVSDLGGLRSVAQLPARAPAPKLTARATEAAPPRRRKGRRGGVPVWAWAAGGVGLAAALLPLLAWGVYRALHHSTPPHKAEAPHTAGPVAERPVPSRPGDAAAAPPSPDVPAPAAPAPPSPPRQPLRVSGPRLLDWPDTHVLTVAFTPDGERLLAGGDSAPYLRLYDVATGKALGARFRGHTSWVNHVAISPDGRLALSAGDDRTMRLWDVTTGLPVGAPAPHDGPVECVAFSPNGRLALSGGMDKAVRLLSLNGVNAQPLFVRAPAAVHTVAFSPDGKRVLAAGEDNVVRLWDRDTRAEVRASTRGTHAAFSPDGRWVLAGEAGSVRLHEASSGNLERAFLGPHRHVNWVSFAPDGGSVLATDHQGQALYLWETSSGELLHTFRGQHNLNRAVFSPDGRHVACGSFRGYVYLWDLSR